MGQNLIFQSDFTKELEARPCAPQYCTQSA